MGLWYLKHLVIEEQKDELDLKLKEMSIKNIKITRIIAWSSLIISLVAGGVTAYRLIDEKQNPRYSIGKEEVNRLLQSPQSISNNLQTIQQTVQTLDTSIKRIKILKR